MGIDNIHEYKPYLGVPIFRDYNVKQVYIGNGQSCHTFWFKSVKDAKKFIEHFRDKIKVSNTGSVTGLIPKNICRRCRCYYSYGSIWWKKYPPYACKELKKRMKREAGIQVDEVETGKLTLLRIYRDVAGGDE